jgi:hypothetical protein
MVIKAAPKTIKPTRITTAAISPPSQWKALLTAKLVGVEDVEVEVAVVAEVEAVVVDVALEADDEADAEVVVMNGSSACIETTNIARRNSSRESDRILRACQAVEMLDRSGSFRCEGRKDLRRHWYHEATKVKF